MTQPGTIRAASRATVLAAFAAAVLWCSQASASKGVVLNTFSGPRGDDATARVRQALGGVRTISPAAFAREKQSLGSERAASKLGVVAVVRGSILRVQGRFALKLIVSSMAGKVLTSQTFLLRSNRVDPTTAASAARTISAAVVRASPPRQPRTRKRPKKARTNARLQPEPKPEPVKTAPATQPSLPMGRPPVGGRDLEIDSAIGDDWSGRDPGSELSWSPERENSIGFVVSRPGSNTNAAGASPAYGADSRTPVQRRRRHTTRVGSTRRIRRVASAEPMPMARQQSDDEPDYGRTPQRSRDDDEPRRWTEVIRASAGLALINRNMIFSGAEISGYTTPALIPALYAGGVIYPFAPFFDDWIGDLGLAARIYHAIGLSSEAPGGGRTTTDMLQTADLGPRFRWVVADSYRSPIVLFGLDFGYQVFNMGASANSPSAVFPDARYVYVKPSVGMDWPFLASGSVRGGATASLDVPVVLQPQPIGNENTSFGKTKTFAFELSFGFYAAIAGFFGQLDFFYRQFQMSFDATTCNASSCVQGAKGARDQYMGMMIHTGYAY